MRSYVQSVAGGTATATVQIQEKGKLRRAVFSAVDAAAGTWELSTSSSSQIGTTSPTSNVLCRLRLSGTAGRISQDFDLGNLPLVPFQNLYLHCTGAGNVGDISIFSS